MALHSPCVLLYKCCLSFQYKIEYSQLASRQLQISVWHAGALKYRVFLGEVVIPLATWNFEDNSMEAFNWYQLKSKVTVSSCAWILTTQCCESYERDHPSEVIEGRMTSIQPTNNTCYKYK